MLVLSRADVERVLDVPDVIEARATVFRRYAEGGGHVPLRKSAGFALEDLATAQLAYERARADGIGMEVSL